MNQTLAEKSAGKPRAAVPSPDKRSLAVGDVAGVLEHKISP
jgi:hypothetical protein